MSFNAAAARARDTTLPIGLRARNLCECLEQFNLLGFQATRERLRARVGAVRQGWTSQQVLDALLLLEQARASRVEYLRDEAERQRARKREGRRHPSTDTRTLHLLWLSAYLRGENARVWQVEDLGACPECAHPEIHHDDRGCRVRHAPGRPGADVCRRPVPRLPSDARRARPGTPQ